jgi:flagellar hook-associated protein 3 FlgL
MRVTESIKSQNILNNILKSSEELYRHQEKLSSGKMISKPSDDPININRSIKFNETLSRTEQYISNIDTIKVNLDNTDGLLFNLTNELNNVEVSLRRYMNSALDGTDYQSVILTDVENLFDNILKIANSSFNGKYIFGGHNTANPPFEIVDDKIKYNGTDDRKALFVGDNVNIDVGINGVDIFSIHKIEGTKYFYDPDQELYSQPTNDEITITVNGNSTDIIIDYDASKGMTLRNIVDSINKAGVEARAIMEETSDGYRLKLLSHYVGKEGEITLQDSLPGGVFEKMGILNNAGDVVGVQNDPSGGGISTVLNIIKKMKSKDADLNKELVELSHGRDNVIKAHSMVGVFAKTLEQRKDLLTSSMIQQKALVSSIEDVDYAEVMMKYNQQMLAYQSALNVGARIMKTTLLDYL